MPMCSRFALLLASALVLSPQAAPQSAAKISSPKPAQPRFTTLYAATSDEAGSGAALAIRGGPPWDVQTAGATEGGQRLRVFGAHVFVIDMWGDRVTFIDLAGGPGAVFDLGPGSLPQDVNEVDGTAWITRAGSAELLTIDLATGVPSRAADLGVLARAHETASLGTMERDGERLFVQVKLTKDPRFVSTYPDRGALGVLDLTTGELIDTQPGQPGVQGVELDGAPPCHKMQILAGTLYVSSTFGSLDGRGGIEMVDLQTLQSVGYALSEEQIGDLGGFVMTSPAGGYFVFHTDIVQSTHLKPFTVADGPGEESEMIVLFDVVDSIGYDALRHRVFLPGGFSFATPWGIHAFSTLTNKPVGGGQIHTALPAHDVMVAGA